VRRGCRASEAACLGPSIVESPVALRQAHHWLTAAAAARLVLVASLANVAAAPVVLAARAAEYSAVEAVQDPQNSAFLDFKIQILLPIC
jgi:hypothetical protein